MSKQLGELNVGQAFIFRGEKYFVVRFKNTRAEITDSRGRSYNLNMTAMIEPLDETTDRNFAKEAFEKTNAVYSMRPGQAFLFRGQKYYFVKCKQTRFEMEDVSGTRYNLSMQASITILDEFREIKPQAPAMFGGLKLTDAPTGRFA